MSDIMTELSDWFSLEDVAAGPVCGREYFGVMVFVYHARDDGPHPWRLVLEYKGRRWLFGGSSNHKASKLAAFKRGWFLARDLSEGKLLDRYRDGG